MKIHDSVLLGWRDECEGDSLKWHKAQNPNLTTAQLEAYIAGYRYGWGQLLSALKFHGYLNVDMKSRKAAQ